MKHSNGRDSTLPVGVLERGEQFFSIWLTEEKKKSRKEKEEHVKVSQAYANFMRVAEVTLRENHSPRNMTRSQKQKHRFEMNE